MKLATVAHLAKWRHLIEPEISRGLTPVTWSEFLRIPTRIYEATGSVVLTRDVSISQTPARSIWVAAGVLHEVKDLVRQVEDEARAEGVSRIVFMGRRGWLRVISGYQEMAVVGLKEL